MVLIRLVAAVGTLLVLTACSAETVKRTTYETLQNVREQECSRTPSVDCEKRESLDVYEELREEALQKN